MKTRRTEVFFSLPLDLALIDHNLDFAPKHWGNLFAGSAATAILDRLNHNGKFITMEGPSYRGRTRKK